MGPVVSLPDELAILLPPPLLVSNVVRPLRLLQNRGRPLEVADRDSNRSLDARPLQARSQLRVRPGVNIVEKL